MTSASVFAVPDLARSWQDAVAGLDTRFHPGRPRPVIFDEEAGRVPGIVRVHLGRSPMCKSTRILCANLFSPHSEVSQVTAVALSGLDHFRAAFMSRLVPVGRGGPRLHEQVFVTGVRLRGYCIAEDVSYEVLDRSLGPGSYRLAGPEVCHHLATLWNDGGYLRTRLVEETVRRTQSLQAGVHQSLDGRCQADLGRVRGILAAFRANLTDSLARLRVQEHKQQAMLDLWPGEQHQQRTRDIQAMEDRLEDLAKEETREETTVRSRYEDVRPYVSSVAPVPVVIEEDAETWGRQS